MFQSRDEVNYLLKRFKDGDSKAFNKLFNLTFTSLIFVAFKKCKNMDLAEDAVAEAFCSVYRKISSFDETKNGYAWLCKIVQNKAVDILKSNKATYELESFSSISTSQIDSIDTRCDAFDLLNRLDEFDYQIIVMRFFEDKTYKEIGEETGLTIKQVYLKINKILKKLKKQKSFKD